MDNLERGKAIKHRRIKLGITTPAEFARATRVDRQTIERVEEEGRGRSSTYDKLEAWLDDRDHQHDEDAPTTPVEAEHEDMLEMSLTIAALGIEAAVKGPAAHPEVIREQLLNLVRGVVRESQPGNS